MGQAATGDFARKPLLPSVEKTDVLVLAPEVVWEHDGYLVYYGIVSPAFGAEEHSINYYLAVRVELNKFERIVLVDGASQDIEELPLHPQSRILIRYKS